eukprot:CAMPEP_0113232122 /NCGR_PEP_ID=MMETSP0008_2-20120614/1786_1 /TAXON_ID=97485 /ORGANISM="Prymnesium parvum" /LENGTH=37 /DNA_ID=CAMNT_0000078825 /DNA_START=747 /DNA_END=860 /DNA_ORIENTATION=- /assembly_acc=CAM_ASM_000153
MWSRPCDRRQLADDLSPTPSWFSITDLMERFEKAMRE